MASFLLSSDVIIEPLVCGYRASPYLVSPFSSPKYISYLVEKVLKSYIKSPESHELAIKNPLLKGGHFVDISAHNSELINRFFQSNTEHIKHSLRLAGDLQELALLIEAKSGESLTDLYDQVPQSIKFCTEFYYQNDGKPAYYLHEKLAYQSNLFLDAMQSVVIYQGNADTRPFSLTTPRVFNEVVASLQLPFCSPGLDKLYASRFQPISEQELEKLLDELTLDKPTQGLLRSFYHECSFDVPTHTDESQELKKPVITYYGHACVLFQYQGKSILIDPLVTYSTSKDDRLCLNDLPDTLDVIAITHLHLDHFCIETLLNIKSKVGRVVVPRTNGNSAVDPNAKNILLSLGFNQVIELDPLDAIEICDGFTLTALPFLGEHGELDITSKSTYLIQSGRESSLVVADVCFDNADMANHISRLVGPIDNLFVGMESFGAPFTWVYGPLLNNQVKREHDHSRRLNGSGYEHVRHLVDAFQCRHVYVYALGAEPWLSNIMTFNDIAEQKIDSQITLIDNYCQDTGIKFEKLSGTKLVGAVYEHD